MSCKHSPRNTERCADCPFVTKTIGSKGPLDSPFVIIGESPGTNELRAGFPFAGESGRLIESVLSEAGLDETGIEPLYINALSCYPPPARKEGAEGRKTMQHAAMACRGRVMEEINAHPRKVILSLGAAAAWTVTGDINISITKARGQVLSSSLAEQGVVLAVHPAFLIRNGGHLPFWKKDLKQAVELLKDHSITAWKEPEWGLISSRAELAECIQRYNGAPLVTADTETDQLHWFNGRMLCLGITRDEGDYVDIIPEDVIYDNLDLMRELMMLQDGTQYAWHNALFDVAWHRAPQHDFGARADHDTMLMSYSLNENRGFHDLDFVAQHWAGIPRHKDMLKQYLPNRKASYRNVPPMVLYKYCAIDLSKQHKVFAPLYKAVKASPEANKLYHRILMPAVEELVHIKLHGVAVDTEVVKQNMDNLQRDIDKYADRINQYAIPLIGAAINPGSPKQMAELLYDKMELKIPGTRSTNEDTIIKIQRRYDHPICNDILNLRELIKRKGTYVQNLLYSKKGKILIEGGGHVKPDGCVYADYKLHGTQTGRLAGADPNMLNQPRGPMIRGQYVARKGKIFIEVDLNQAELRSLAVMSGDKLLKEIYTKNEVSIHDITTSSFFGSKQEMADNPEVLEKAIALLQYFGEDRSPGRIYGEAKMRGKAVNFGIVYGREAFSLAAEFNISVYEAQRWIDAWFELYPQAGEFIEWCRAKPAEGRDLITMFGRRKRHGVVAREKLKALENEAANFPHQSTASDIMLEALIRCGPTLRNTYDANVWNELYDAIYYEIPYTFGEDNSHIAESIRYVQGVINQVPIDVGITSVPFIGDAKVGFTWGFMKDWGGSVEESLPMEEIERAVQRQQELWPA